MQPRTGTQASVSAGSSDRCERWLRQSGFLDGCFSNPSAHTPAHTHFGGLMERQSLMWWVWDGAGVGSRACLSTAPRSMRSPRPRPR